MLVVVDVVVVEEVVQYCTYCTLHRVWLVLGYLSHYSYRGRISGVEDARVKYQSMDFHCIYTSPCHTHP